MYPCHFYLFPNHISQSLHLKQASHHFCTHLVQPYLWICFAKVAALPGRPPFLSCMTRSLFPSRPSQRLLFSQMPSQTNLPLNEISSWICITWHLCGVCKYVILALLTLSICCLCVTFVFLGVNDLVCSSLVFFSVISITFENSKIQRNTLELSFVSLDQVFFGLRVRAITNNSISNGIIICNILDLI